MPAKNTPACNLFSPAREPVAMGWTGHPVAPGCPVPATRLETPMKLTLPALILFATACFACIGVAASANGLLVTTRQDMAEERSEPFTQERFMAAQAAGHPILVDISASWCPTCRRQGEVIGQILERGEFADLVILKLDWDDQRQTAHGFGARRQSTLVVYRGADEVGRAVAITSDSDIQALLSQAYAN
jgi:thioredoxin 1